MSWSTRERRRTQCRGASFSKDPEETERFKNGKRFKGPGGEHVENYGQQVMSVRTPPAGCVRQRPLVPASHIIQAGSDLFIGKNEAYIMNRKKKEKSALRKEGNVYVFGLR